MARRPPVAWAGRRHVYMSLAVAGLVLTVLIGDGFWPGSSVSATWYPPLDSPVVDEFRPPRTQYGSGNRGLEYGDTKGKVVVAVDAGRVVFSGLVGGSRHVVVAHGDGLRSTYAYLNATTAVRGQFVARGQKIGVAADHFHLTARLGAIYVDPALLLAGAEVVIQLTPSGLLGSRPPVDLVGMEPTRSQAYGGALGGLNMAGASGLVDRGGKWFGQEALDDLVVTAQSLLGLSPAGLIVDSAASVDEWHEQECTPAGGPGHSTDLAWYSDAGAGRVLIQVGGLGSKDDDASVGSLDPESLGYLTDDVVGFSYAGGCTPQPFDFGVPGENSLTRDLSALAASAKNTDPSNGGENSEGLAGVNPYGAADTYQSIETSALRLAELVEAASVVRPGRPIDIAAHSLGGVVTRRALEILEDRRDAGGSDQAVLPSVIITIGSPHGGAELGVGADLLSGSSLHSGILDLAPDWFEAESIAEISSYGPDRLDPPRPPPEEVTVVAVSGDIDIIVPAPAAMWPSAENVLVSNRSDASAAHSALPGHPDVAIEFGLALSGEPARCVGMVTALVGSLRGHGVTAIERSANVAIGIGRWLL